VLERELAELDKRISRKTAEISDFKQRNKLLSSSEAEQLALNQTLQLERDRNEVVVELQAVQERIKATGSDPPAGGGQPVITNPLIEKARKLEARKNALTDAIDRLRNGTRGTVTSVAVMQALEIDKRILEELRTNVEMNLAEARMQSESPSVDIVQVQTARPPVVPSFPIHALNAIVALIFGFAAGCYTALLLEYLGRLRLERIRRNLIADAALREEVES
jgi:DNA repair exonuclease SbcCD ATPase subunit